MYKFIESTERHPKGGYWIKYTVRKGEKFFKSEGKIWVEDYPTSKAAEMAAKALDTVHYNKALAKAEGKAKEEQEAQKKAVRDVWTLQRVAEDRIAKYGDASMPTQFSEVIRLAGPTLPDNFEAAYWNAVKHLRGTEIPFKGGYRSEATINRYKAVFRMIFKHAIMVKACPPDTVLIKYDLEPESGRDRVWTPEEKEKLFQAMIDLKSWLYWPVYFSAYNPIRAGDLFKLARENYDLVKNQIEFTASKTKRKKNRTTCLKQIDHNLREYFESLPKRCNLLFPRATESGFCYPVNVYKEEWKRVLEKAEIEDFHFHDLKHCAITYLLDNGYSRADLKQCGIQYSDSMIDRYYHFDADKAPVLPGFEKPGLVVYKEKEA